MWSLIATAAQGLHAGAGAQGLRRGVGCCWRSAAGKCCAVSLLAMLAAETAHASALVEQAGLPLLHRCRPGLRPGGAPCRPGDGCAAHAGAASGTQCLPQ